MFVRLHCLRSCWVHIWQMKSLLGQGTQGKVWDATLKRSGKSVVIKCLHQNHVEDVNSKDASKREQAKLFWRAFRNEIDILEACSGHPNIIKIVGRSPDYSQFMMEKAEIDLNKCLRVNRQRLTLGQCHKWFKDILVGLEHLHKIGVSCAGHTVCFCQSQTPPRAIGRQFCMLAQGTGRARVKRKGPSPAIPGIADLPFQEWQVALLSRPAIPGIACGL